MYKYLYHFSIIQLEGIFLQPSKTDCNHYTRSRPSPNWHSDVAMKEVMIGEKRMEERFRINLRGFTHGCEGKEHMARERK